MEKTPQNANKVEFVVNLNRLNFKDHIDTIIDSVNLISAVSDISIADLERLTGIHNITLRRILMHNIPGIFRTYNRLNNFVRKVITQNAKEYNTDEVEMLVLDENITGDIN